MIIHKGRTANARFYILDREVENLPLGPVSEELGITTLNCEEDITNKQVDVRYSRK